MRFRGRPWAGDSADLGGGPRQRPTGGRGGPGEGWGLVRLEIQAIPKESRFLNCSGSVALR
jgi:hypothetical protein